MKKTPLYSKHLALGAKMVPFAGYEMPVQYEGVTAEHMAVRSQAGLFDVSHMGQFRVKGESVEAYLQQLTTNDVSKLTDGKIQYSAMLNEQGGIIDDLLVYRVSAIEYLVVVNAGNLDKDWAWFNQQNKHGVDLSNESDQWALLALQGPAAKAIVAELLGNAAADLSYYTFTEVFFGEIKVFISATGYTGAGGFELMVAADKAEELWDLVMNAGSPHGLVAAGLAARDTLRLEMGYCLHGNDISENHNPLEAGLGWITKFSKDFVGKAALEEMKQTGLKKKLVGVKLNERGIPRAGYVVADSNGNEIGVITSGTMSPILSQGIAMGYLANEFASPGTTVDVLIRNKPVKAEVVKFPFVEPTV